MLYKYNSSSNFHLKRRLVKYLVMHGRRRLASPQIVMSLAFTHCFIANRRVLDTGIDIDIDIVVRLESFGPFQVNFIELLPNSLFRFAGFIMVMVVIGVFPCSSLKMNEEKFFSFTIGTRPLWGRDDCR